MRVTVKSCGNMAVLTDTDGRIVDDEIDEDYKFLLEKHYASNIDVITDNNADGVDMVVGTGQNSDNDDDYSDPQYKMFLEKLREEGKSYVLEAFVNNQLVHVRYEEEEAEEEDQRLYNELNSDTSSMSKGFTWREETGNIGTTVRQGVQVSDGGTEPCNKRPGSDVSSVLNHNCNSDVELEDIDEDYLIYLKSFRTDGDELVRVGSELEGNSPRQNSLVSDRIFDTPKEHDDTDEDYQLFVNSAEEDITKEDKVEDGSNSTDSELIILEPDQFSEGTPFVSSKKYHSLCLENERSSNESRALSAFAHSQFRKRLMEILERPFDQEEYNLYLHEVHLQRQKERHRESRQGLKSCRVEGVNKSYLQSFPSLRKATCQAKKPHKNLTQEGVFRPWEDEPCLAILQKL